jgi:hypothetical protein
MKNNNLALVGETSSGAGNTADCGEILKYRASGRRRKQPRIEKASGCQRLQAGRLAEGAPR